ncbi:MAG: MgtC/SapB family protein [Dehalococcoidia bacterium]|nr:MgtC/SapB family protein [Dehalococcoidia bacterium]
MPLWLEMILRLLLASASGAAIGYQRKRAGKPVGMRTYILVTLGAALFTIVSVFGFTGAVDPSRVAAGVVVGIGFIGAGVIFRRPQAGEVTGLTTAASMWAAAAVGLAVGSGLYLISIVATLLIVISLVFSKILD